MKKYMTLLALVLCLPVTVFASPIFVSAPQTVQAQQTSFKVKQIQKTQANSWGLSVKQYQRYRLLMKNTPSRQWYKNLDPSEVLALNASNPKEMLKYAKIQARNMHVRVTRELAFDNLYTKAYSELYPNEKPIMSPNDHVLNNQTLKSGDRVWLFVGVNTPLGQFAYQHLIKVVQQAPSTTLDIYFVGKKISPQSIQAWAKNANIPRGLVNKRITLNYGNTRFNDIVKGRKVNLPYVGIVHNTHFQPVSLSSVLE